MLNFFNFPNFYKILVKNNLPAKYFYSTTSKKSKWKSVIGLEIHAQISSESKLFSGARTEFASPINCNVSLFDASIPGTLPVLNKRCVEAGLKTALALSCNINEVSMFDRKHYFYADLPAGYQITQQRAPLAVKGQITFPVFVPGVTKKPYYKTARLTQLQLEQDSGKSLHDDLEGRSLVDLNRAGVPLMELVFEPDLEDGEEAAALVKELVLIMNRLGTCSCKMEEGALRVDANISIHRENEPLGTRTEVKNIGSVRGVAQAIAYEIKRQIEIKDKGGRIVNETRAYDATTKSTIAMRDKEVVQDYRFMPEPNLPPLHLNLSDQISEDFINVCVLKRETPALPEDTRQLLVHERNLTQEIAIILVNEETLLKYFNEILTENPKRSPKLVSNILINELLKICNKKKVDITECGVSACRIGSLIDMMETQEINLNLARLILEEMFSGKKSPREISAEKNWKLISDSNVITEMVLETLNKNPKMVQQYRGGKTKVLLALAGEIAKKSDNRIDMAKVMEILREKLK